MGYLDPQYLTFSLFGFLWFAGIGKFNLLFLRLIRVVRMSLSQFLLVCFLGTHPTPACVEPSSPFSAFALRLHVLI